MPKSKITPAQIRKARERLEMSQEDFAHHVGATARTVYRWETGESAPNPKTLAGQALIQIVAK
jgi:DNA-binding transcriptional regulator YiaG